MRLGDSPTPVDLRLPLLAAVAEVWRYVLLLFSRSDALSPEAVGVSDALVWFGGWSSVVATIAAGVLMISWSLWTYRAAADRAGTRAWRSRRWVVAGWVVPGWNLVAPGSLLAETEHAALAGRREQRGPVRGRVAPPARCGRGGRGHGIPHMSFVEAIASTRPRLNEMSGRRSTSPRSSAGTMKARRSPSATQKSAP